MKSAVLIQLVCMTGALVLSGCGDDDGGSGAGGAGAGGTSGAQAGSGGAAAGTGGGSSGTGAATGGTGGAGGAAGAGAATIMSRACSTAAATPVLSFSGTACGTPFAYHSPTARILVVREASQPAGTVESIGVLDGSQPPDFETPAGFGYMNENDLAFAIAFSNGMPLSVGEHQVDLFDSFAIACGVGVLTFDETQPLTTIKVEQLDMTSATAGVLRVQFENVKTHDYLPKYPMLATDTLNSCEGTISGVIEGPFELLTSPD